jgi:hypothetical protein
MTRESGILVGVIVVLTLGVGLLFLAPKVDEALAPELVRAHVAVRLPGDSVSRVGEGPHHVDSGAEVGLEAVLEARRRDGSLLYYTAAKTLSIDGVLVPPEQLAVWEQPDEVRVRWFTVEPGKSEIEVASVADLEALRFEEILRPEWPRSWSVPLVVDPKIDDGLDVGRLRPPFGTVRLHTRIEIFGPDQKLVPVERYSSTGAAQLPDTPAAVATVVVGVPGELEDATQRFGLINLKQTSTDPAVASAIDRYHELRLAVVVPSLLRTAFARHQVGVDNAPWVRLEAGRPLAWGRPGVLAGDLFRVGGRVVLLYQDSDGNGQLDLGDRCLDFERGTAVRSLGEVFASLESVEWLAWDSQ